MNHNTLQLDPPRRWEGWANALLILVFVLFGLEVERRSAFMQRRMGDLGCYLRAAWAVRAGEDMYGLVEDNGWHYNYPPLYAILLTPLADPPADADHTHFVRYEISVAVVYLLNVLWLVLGVNALASALEKASADPQVRSIPRWRRRWWLLRTLPILTCLPPIGHTLMRGQANILLLALICGLIAASMRGRNLVAGLCLAGAICLKIFPAFLLLVPLWRRDWRCLGGCALGLFVGLVLIPFVALGPRMFVTEYRELAKVLVGPALGMGEDKTRAEELINVTATDNQSFVAVLHNTLHLDHDTRPKEAPPWEKRTAWLLGGVFTLLTLAASYRRRTDNGLPAAFFIGALVLVMILTSPVCHTHYFVMSVPLVMALVARSWERDPSNLRHFSGLNVWLLILLAAELVGYTLPLILPHLEVTRDVGVSMYSALLLWLLACVAMFRGETAAAKQQATGMSPPLAA
jgi:hypothetical protein